MTLGKRRYLPFLVPSKTDRGHWSTSKVVAIALSITLLVLSLAGLLLGFRHDAIAARTGGLSHWTVAASPLRASSFVGIQTASFLLGGLAVLLGSYAASFAILWPPFRRHFVDLTWLPVTVMTAMVLFAFLVQRYLLMSHRSPIR